MMLAYKYVVVFSLECIKVYWYVFIGRYLMFIYKCCLIIRKYDILYVLRNFVRALLTFFCSFSRNSIVFVYIREYANCLKRDNLN